MKRLDLLTLAAHGFLILLAALTLNDYADFFLISSAAVLIFLIVRSVRSKQHVLSAHALGILLQFLTRSLGLVHADSGAFGLGGGGFALFFYDIALAVVTVLLIIIQLIRVVRKT